MLLPSDELTNKIAEALIDPGYIILDKCLPDAILQDLSQILLQYEGEGMKAAGVGRGKDFHQNHHIRGDNIRWLSEDNPAETAFLEWMDNLRASLNQHLFLGLQDYESHFAIYPAGSCYQKHLDAFKGNAGRKISTVLYLNQNWDHDSGGELLIYTMEDQLLQKIVPKYGRMVIFLSENFPHEVKPAACDRRSIAGWFRIRSEFLV